LSNLGSSARGKGVAIAMAIVVMEIDYGEIGVTGSKLGRSNWGYDRLHDETSASQSMETLEKTVTAFFVNFGRHTRWPGATADLIIMWTLA
jgi:hypothetical protein